MFRAPDGVVGGFSLLLSRFTVPTIFSPPTGWDMAQMPHGVGSEESVCMTADVQDGRLQRLLQIATSGGWVVWSTGNRAKQQVNRCHEKEIQNHHGHEFTTRTRVFI